MARGASKTPTDPFSPDFDALVEGLLSEFHVPGLSIAVVHGKETFAKGYGYARITSPSAPSSPMTPQTLLGTASTTKAFTSLVLAQVVHEEQLPKQGNIVPDRKNSSRNLPITWQTPVSTLLPGDFVLPTAELTDAVTIEDILCHRSGLPSCDNACLGLGAGTHADSPASTTRKLRHFPLPANTTPATFRTRFIYSNTMYGAAQHLIETLTDQPLRRVFRERIFDVLGMKRTFFGLHDIEERAVEITVDMAKGYTWISDDCNQAADKPDKGKFAEVSWRGSPEQGGAGDIVSCVSDYALWMQAVIGWDDRILSEEGWKEVLRPRIICDGEYPTEGRKNFGIETYGLGWFRDYYRGQEIVEHSGGDPGIGTLVHLLPDHKYGIAIFANTCDSSDPIRRIISMHLTDNLLNVPDSERVDFAALARKENAEQAADEVHQNFADQSRKLFPEIEKDGRPAAYPQVELGLPLSSCAGHFRHPGYGVIDVEVTQLSEVRQRRRQPPSTAGGTAEDKSGGGVGGGDDQDQRDVLFVSMNERTFPAELVLSHLNAGFFVVEKWDILENKVLDWLRAEVRIGVGGDVVAIGIEFADGPEVEGWVWFDRIPEARGP